MKTSKSPENKEVTPSKKKLKQARLPFKLISDVSPKPTAPQTRKRKLSLPEAEPVTKVGKICKENDFAKDLVVISDEESREEESKQEVKQVNPFVKLVDTARKKKLQKKTPKKKSKSSRKLKNGATDKIETADDDFDDVEMVEVDVIIHEDEGKSDTKTDLPNEDSVLTKPPEQTEKSAEKVSTETVSSIICLEDSNQSSDLTDSIKKSTVNSHTDVMINTKDIETDKKQNKQSETCETEKFDTKSDAKPAEPKETSKSNDPVTPKRSARNKSKNEPSIPNASTSKLDESVNSNPSTPKRNTSLVQDESMNDSTVSANLTPKQLQKKLESAKKREEREKEKQERERKRQEEKDERAKQRQEKEEQRKRERDEKEEQRKRERDEKEEQKKRERDEKEEQKKKEREEKEKLKEMERKLKEMKEELKRKEKEDKEEQKKKEREAREEEKRKKQEALELEKQEQEQKKKKAAEAFVNFFVPKQKVEKDQVSGPISKNSVLSSFTIKVDMRLAPTTRNNISEERKEALEKYIEEQDENASYLKNLKDGTKPLSSTKTWPLSERDEDNDDDVMIVEDELPPMDGAEEIITCETAPREKLRPKLFSFHENRRPPYWGTWRKKSTAVKPRRPFGQDEKQLDYEVDSDDDWEEEQEGESLDGSACGSEDEGDRADDYEVDNELFVPHGYLSDEEATMDEDDVLSLSPEAQKAKLKYLEDEFESEMKKPTEKLKPRLYGLLWESEDGGKPDNCVDALWNYFGKFAMIMNDPTPLLQPAPKPEDAEKKVKKKKAAPEGDDQSPKSEKKKKAKPEKESKKLKAEVKKVVPNQPGINSFLTKLKTA